MAFLTKDNVDVELKLRWDEKHGVNENSPFAEHVLQQVHHFCVKKC